MTSRDRLYAPDLMRVARPREDWYWVIDRRDRSRPLMATWIFSGGHFEASSRAGYGSSLKDASSRCTRCGGTGLVAVADPGEQDANGHEPGRLGHEN